MGSRLRRFAAAGGLAIVLLALAFSTGSGGVRAQSIEAKIAPEARLEIEAALDRGEARDLLVTYDAAAVRARAKQMQIERRLPRHDDEILRTKAIGYAETKAAVAASLGAARPQLLKSYEQLPVEFVRVQSRESLAAMLADPRVAGVALPEVHTRMLQQSLPLINQPGAAQQGYYGAGTSVAVLDTGVDYTRAAFGACGAPGPACKVIYAQDFAPEDGLRDDDGHGTHVAAIVLGVAPETKIIALDVFRSDGFAYSQDVIAAINWSIQQKSQYNIAAINLSLGSGKFTSPISSPRNANKRAIDDARDAGIVVVVASGNDAYTDALASPAAVDTAVSVGAVYDSAMGAINWSKCSDPATTADRVTCFSNSASFLTALGPGALISAAGEQMGGTSQAAPHLAGAVAVLHSAYPSETVNQIITRLTAGVAVTDPRNALVKPRVNLAQALGLDLVPDAFQFQDQTDAAPGVPVTSNPVTVVGLVGSAPVSVSIPGEYSVNGGAFVTEARTVANGDVIRVRVVSSTSPGGVVSSTLTVGGVSDTFSVTTSASAAAPAVQLAPGSLAFGGVAIGAGSTQTLTLANAGNATLSGVSFTVTPGQDFSIASTDCGSSLAPGQSCAIAVAFSPTAPVERSTALSVSSNAPGSPHLVPLGGTGVTSVALAEALDNPSLTFSSGGNSTWFGQTAVSFSGGDAARSGLLDHLQSTTLETTVTGPGTLSFHWKVSSEPNFDYLRFYIDGVEFAAISGEVDWAGKTYSLGAGSHTLRWTYAKDSAVASGADAGWVDAVTFTPGEAVVSLSASSVDFGGVAVGSSGSQAVVVTNAGSAPLAIGSVTITGLDYSRTADSCSGASIASAATCSVTVQFSPATLGTRAGSLIVSSNASGSPHVATLTGSGIATTTLGAALDNGLLAFTTGASAPWFAQTAVMRVAGNSTAQSGATGDFQVSYVETTVTGPGRLSFFWKVSSEPVYDRLMLMLDGVAQGWISGEFDWEQRFYDIGAGTHVVRWAYVRTAEEPGGADAGWLDEISFQALAAPANLAEALDAPWSAWRTIGIVGSAAPWTGQGSISVSGGDAAESPVILDGQSSEMRTTVRGPGVLTFQWKVSSEFGYDFLCFHRDYTDIPYDCISGEVDWAPRTFNIPPGVWPLKWIYSKDALDSAGSDRGWVDQVSFTATDLPLHEAADSALLSFETSPSAPWYGQSVQAAIGGDAAQSAPIEDGQHTWLQTTVTGPGTLSFYWKVSSEAGYDTLRFYVDGAEVPAIPAISGEPDWTQRSVPIGPGAHVVTWAYWKDSYCCTAGLDSAWVDSVVFTPTAADTQPPGIPAGLTALAVAASQIDLSWMPSADDVGVTEYRIYRDSAQIATVPGSTLGYADAALTASTLYSYTVVACDAAGNCSAPSVPVSATTLAPPDTQAPTVPAGLSATAVSSSQVNLAWSAATDNSGVTSYRVYRGGSLIATVSGSTLAYSDTGLSAVTAYSYTVSACDAAGNCSAQSAGASVTTPAVATIFTPLLKRGWNLMGNSLELTLDVVTAFGSPGTPVSGVTEHVNSIWKWNATLGLWQFYAPSLTAQQNQDYASANGFEVLASVEPGTGYWVNLKRTAPVEGVTLSAQIGVPVIHEAADPIGGTPAKIAGRNLVTGWQLVAIADALTPSAFNESLSGSTPQPNVVKLSFQSLWAWDAVLGTWYFYAPQLHKDGVAQDVGLALVKQYADNNGFLHFEEFSRKLGVGTGFWLRK